MKIRTRLGLLLGALVIVFGLAVAWLREAHRAEAENMLTSLRTERSGLLDQLLNLGGQSLRNFANDYGPWDEMVGFMTGGDRQWAAVNIDASLATFGAEAAWVLRPDGSVHYAARQPASLDTGVLPFGQPAFLEKLQREKFLNFYLKLPAGLFEFRAAPVVPSDDLKREQTPRGWFIVARRWDDAYLRRLSETLQSSVALGESAGGPANPTGIHLQRPLYDWRNQRVQTLRVDYDSAPLALLIEGNREEALLLYVFGFSAIAFVLVTLSLWVITPLNRLAQSLDSGQAEPIRSLQARPDEFGHLARQLAQSFVQRDALRDSETRLRQSTMLHDRLARDLHDGIIQSIYAAGLGLESARNLLKTDPTAAEQRLASCQRMFNDALWQVRKFIEVLEPENAHPHSPAQSLAALVGTMQSLQPIPIASDIDRELAGRIGPNQELHVLQMAREILSNALRHSGARQVRVSLRAFPDGYARLEISDDGHGFSPAERAGTGRGLTNLAARTREIDGRLEIDAAPGKGARIAVWFKPSN